MVMVDDFRSGFFMTGEAWLDENGRNIWFEHDCKSSRAKTMLPYPKWKASQDGSKVEPSIHCLECGFHDFVKLMRKPEGGE